MPPFSNCDSLTTFAFAYKDVSQLAKRIAFLNEDERQVLTEILDFVLKGLEKGRTVYGELNLLTDKRDLEQEACEEIRDCLVYLTADKLKKTLS